MPLDHGNALMPGYSRIVNFDPIPHIGYAKIEVKTEPQQEPPRLETVIVTSVPEGGTVMNVGDRFTMLTPAGHPALHVRFEFFLFCSRFLQTPVHMTQGVPQLWGLDKQSKLHANVFNA